MNTFENISWEKLGFANMPSWLRGLTSQDHKAFVFGYNAIEDLVVRGTVHSEDTDRGYGLSKIVESDVHLYLVPIFIDFLGRSETPDKATLLYLLILMARYAKYKDGTESDKAKAIRIHDIIWGGMSIFIELLYYSDSQIKTSAASLLSEYPEHSDYILPILIQVLDNETDETTKANLCWSIHYLLNSQGSIGFDAKLEEYLEHDDKSPLKIVAAMCLVDIFLESAPQKARNLVLEFSIIFKTTPMSQLPPGYENIHRIMKKLKESSG